MMRLRPGSFPLTALLALLTTIGPMSIDLYVPALPDIGRVLEASASAVQLTISIYIAGFAGGQIVYGPVSDRYGRRPVLIAALAIYCVGSLLCAIAPSVGTLIAARFLQGFGASGAIVLARSVVRDLYEGPRAGRELSIMAMIMGVAPIVAPLVGGALQTFSGWRADFIFTFGAGAIGFLLAWLLLPETRHSSAAAPHSFGEILRGFRVIGRNRDFRINIGLVALSFGGLFAWISGSPFVLQDLYGLSALSYGMAFAIAASGFITGSTVAARIVGRIGLDRTIGIGAMTVAAGGAALIVSTLVLPRAGFGLSVPVAIYLAGMGMLMPQAFAAALQPFPDRAGAASSLGGLIQQAAAALMGVAVGHAIGTTAWPVVLPMAAAGFLTLAVWWFTRKAPQPI